MKQTIISLIALLIFSGVFFACNDENEDAIYINPVTPAVAAAGTYEGEWERLSFSDSVLEVGPGDIIIAPDTSYVATISFRSEQFSLDKQVLANITYANDRFYYFNYSTTTDLGVEFAGIVDENLVNTVSFTIKQVDGRKIKEFKYTFRGIKIVNEVTQNTES